MSTFPSTHSSSNLILRLVSILSYILAECYFALVTMDACDMSS